MRQQSVCRSRVRLAHASPPQLGNAMFDRYDPRDGEHARGRDWDRALGGRGSAGEHDAPDERHPRDIFTQGLALPRRREHQLVRARDRVCELNATDGGVLATIGAFRVVSERDLHDDGRADGEDTRRSTHHLEREGLVRMSPLTMDDRAVVLTDRGRDVLETHREQRPDRAHEPRQAFYAGLRRPRELTHDAQVYRAYQRAEERLRADGGRIRRVVLDYELKRDYQRFLHERNRGKKDCAGRPDRRPDEIAQWAEQRDLPCDRGHVRFPDARVEYVDRDGRTRHEDLEVVTAHYRGAHASATTRSGFTCYVSMGSSVGGRGGGGRRTRDPRLMDEFL